MKIYIIKIRLVSLRVVLKESVFKVTLNFGQILEALGVVHYHEIVAVSTN